MARKTDIFSTRLYYYNTSLVLLYKYKYYSYIIYSIIRIYYTYCSLQYSLFLRINFVIFVIISVITFFGLLIFTYLLRNDHLQFDIKLRFREFVGLKIKEYVEMFGRITHRTNVKWKSEEDTLSHDRRKKNLMRIFFIYE